MAIAVIFPVLLYTAVSRTSCEPAHGKSNANAATIFGELLKPPPPPLQSIFPVPFHGGSGRTQRHNLDLGYQYQPPPPPPPSTISSSSNFKFPAPFYKQYNFNFVPPPQAFTTTPSPNLFQKVSSWLFPTAQGGYDSSAQPISNNVGPIKKDCNPCNVVPWIPVIRYDLAAKNLKNVNPTYGAPSPTANAQYNPQPFIPQSYSHLTPGVPHAEYGPPPQTQTTSPLTGSLSSTYGPPSPTHTVDYSSKNPLSSTYGAPSSSFVPSQQFIPSSPFNNPSSSYGVPSSTYDAPSSSYGAPSSSYGAPSSTYGAPSSSYGAPSSTYGAPSSSFSISSSSYNVPSSTYGPPSSTYSTPSPSFQISTPSTFTPVTPINQISTYQSQFNDWDIFKTTGPSAIINELQPPKLSIPSGFKNSYGEPITNSIGYSVPYPVSATAAESSKIKTEVLPTDSGKHNGSFALGNPSPFAPNKGRNIHTLQPVALPNLSVSPLPPIFNARPFRTLSATKLLAEQLKNGNNKQKSTSQIEITKSVPLTEYTHSVEHPIKIINSPGIDFSYGKTQNQTKAYRNIVNSYVIDQNRDISSQASEDHISATKNIQEINDSSFETTGADSADDIYDIPSGIKHNKIPNNHKDDFTDLRGVTDDDVDKFRAESNLQSIDSPLLYLKPSAPHKDFDNFLMDVSTASNGNDYELYDDGPTSSAPQLSTPTHLWDDNRSNHGNVINQSPTAQEDSNKPKIVQIIIPYTSDQTPSTRDNVMFDPPHKDWQSILEDYQARKVPSNTENYFHVNTVSDNYEVETTTTEEPMVTVTESYDSERYNTPAILNDLYDVKEPPFDIIKLQNNIDDWTEQQYSQHYRAPPKVKITGKYAHAKQIPDEYFTTTLSPTNYVTTVNYDYYDHEPSGSIRHSVTENNIINETVSRFKEYNTILRDRGKSNKGNSKLNEDSHKPHIYMAASSFRSSTTTVAPWGKIETSISPLTKEKVYVVTSKPWQEGRNATDWYTETSFESMKTTAVDNTALASDNLPFKSPRFLSRPSFEGSEIMKSDASYGLSKSWHQRINDLEARMLNTKNTTLLPEGPQHVPTNTDEDTTDTTTAGHPSD